MNDCKHGYISRDGLRRTLLKVSTFPVFDANAGWHEFVSALLPYAEDTVFALCCAGHTVEFSLDPCEACTVPDRFD